MVLCFIIEIRNVKKTTVTQTYLTLYGEMLYYLICRDEFKILTVTIFYFFNYWSLMS